jgi:hypothetical protein
MRGEIIAAFKGNPDQELNCEQIAETIGGASSAQVREWCRDMVKKGELAESLAAGQRARYKLGAKAGFARDGGRVYESASNVKAAGARTDRLPNLTGPLLPPSKPLGVADLLKDAEEEVERVGNHSELMPVVHRLRLKKFAWKDISTWLAARGIVANHTSLNTTYKAWIKAGHDKDPA